MLWPVIVRWNSMVPTARDIVRLALAVLVVVAVLGGAYLMVRAPGSGSAVVVNPPEAPVRAAITGRINLGPNHAVLAGGGAGVFVVRQPRHGAAGKITIVNTADAKLGRSQPLDVSPLGIGVDKHAVWVLGGDRVGNMTTLLRLNPHTLHVTHGLVLAKASSCATNPLASCNPVPVSDGVWVPLVDRIIHVTADGRTADLNVPLGGHLWDVTASGNTLWAVAETGLYRIDGSTGRYQRISLRPALGAGVYPNHVVASRTAVWVSSFATNRADLGVNRLTLVEPRGAGMMVARTLPYPGAGSMALLSGGLWVDRFDGQGELDRLNAQDGRITGPIVVTTGDITWIASQPRELWVTVYTASGDRRELDRITLTPAS